MIQVFFGSVNSSWADETYGFLAQPEVTALETRSLLNAKLGWAWDDVSVYVFGSNLLDDDYALYRSPAAPPIIPQTGKAGPPRMFGIGVDVSW